MVWYKRSSYYPGKRILIIGGSSGLGLSLAKDAKSRGCKVTITARSLSSMEALQKEYALLSVDITDEKSVASIPTDFDMIFCCAGYALPSLAKDIEILQVERQLNCNFLGPVRVYLHFLQSASLKHRKHLVLIASTLALHSFGGYGMYAPSKAALSSFYEAVECESSMQGLDLSIYYVSTIQSPGFIEEQKHKPLFTKKIEGSSMGTDSLPDNRAKHLLDSLPSTRIVYSDFITRLFSKSAHICSLADIFAVIIAPVFWLGFKIFSYYMTHKYYPKTAKNNGLKKKE
ncbi:3-dehydrosphinganine reductase [Nematocida ausubeli]|nr:3-dehydrosphinganine reductase [Nematocida ausubeli]KAI5147735.1 3-dehydrosphinganine reductase [Nematocida ausubeli]KAI5161794.1 3-dehydrosphinganine reductase [Nematocida ausubeli]